MISKLCSKHKKLTLKAMIKKMNMKAIFTVMKLKRIRYANMIVVHSQS